MDVMEQAGALEREIRLEQGFPVYVLGNGRVEVGVVPELGAKIISLKNLRSGREWMWHPDPVTRVRMRWDYSYLFPPMALCSEDDCAGAH